MMPVDGATQRSSYVSLVGPTTYAPDDLDRFADAFLQNNAAHFEQGDFATPLLNLAAAIAKDNMTMKARKEWLAATFGQILYKTQLEAHIKEIARASLRPLIDTYFDIAKPGHYYHSMFDVHYDTSYRNKINTSSFDATVGSLVRFYGSDLTRENNLVPLFYHGYFRVSSMLFADSRRHSRDGEISFLDRKDNKMRMTLLGRVFVDLFVPIPDPVSPDEPAPLVRASEAAEPLLADPHQEVVLADQWPEINNPRVTACIALCAPLFAVFEALDQQRVRILYQPNELSSDYCCIVL